MTASRAQKRAGRVYRQALKHMSDTADIKTNTAAINASVAALHGTITTGTDELKKKLDAIGAIAHADAKSVRRGIGHVNKNLIGTQRVLNGINTTLVSMAADIAAMNARGAAATTPPPGAHLSPSDIADLKKAIESGNAKAHERWKIDQEIQGEQANLAQNTEERADNTDKFNRMKGRHDRYAQKLQSDFQTARQQNHLAGMVIGFEQLLILHPLRFAVRGAEQLAHRSRKAATSEKRRTILDNQRMKMAKYEKT